MAEVVAQKLAKTVKTEIDKAIIYYGILSVLNGLGLTKKQIQLLAFTAVRGTITPLAAREEFATMFNSSLNSIENLKSKLVIKGLLVRVGGMHRVFSPIELDFSKNVVLQVKLKTNEGSRVNTDG